MLSILYDAIRAFDERFQRARAASARHMGFHIEGAHGKGSGFSVYTSIGHTASDAIAEIFCATYLRRLPQFRFRRNLADGDLDHEENFYVLKNTTCPALLVENLFFDNRREAEFLLSESGQTQIAMTLFEAILTTEKMELGIGP